MTRYWRMSRWRWNLRNPSLKWCAMYHVPRYPTTRQGPLTRSLNYLKMARQVCAHNILHNTNALPKLVGWFSTERERQLTTAHATQITTLTNGWATNWAQEVVFSPFRAFPSSNDVPVLLLNHIIQCSNTALIHIIGAVIIWSHERTSVT